MIANARQSCAIGVMAKAPQAGRSKTRLCPPLLPDQAATLSAAFLRDTTENMALAARSASIVPYAAYAPVGSESLLMAHLCGGTGLVLADGNASMPAGVEGFGRCLLQATRDMLARGHRSACVLSSDCPTLPTRFLVQAAEILLAPGDRAVLGATEDGGYYLLGLKATHAQPFQNITWSTERVADETRARIRDAGLELVELDPWFDVDDAASLKMLLDNQGGYAAPHTREAIASLKLHALPQFAQPQALA